MTPDPDAPVAPPEPDSAAPALPAAEYRAVEAAVAGAAGLLLGRILLGRAGGLVTGLAALGLGLLGKRLAPSPKPQAAEPLPEPGSNGSALEENGAPPMKVRLETGPVPTIDAVAALAGQTRALSSGFAPLAVVVPPPAVSEPAAEPADLLIVDAPQTAPPLPVAAEETPPPAVAGPEPELSPDDAGAFAEMPALFYQETPALRVATAPVPPLAVESLTPLPADPALPVAAEPVALHSLLEQAAADLEISPPPADAAPLEKSTPGPSLLYDLPGEFVALEDEQEPGPRGDFLLLPEALAPRSLPPLAPVVAALSESLPSIPEPAPQAEPAPEPVSAPEVPREVPALSAVEPNVTRRPPATAEIAPLRATPLHVSTTESAPAPWTPPIAAIPVTTPVPPPAVRNEVAPWLAAIPLTSPEPSPFPAAPAPAAPPAPDPDEIWRQAAAELSALRPASPPAHPPLPWATPEPAPAIAPPFPIILPPVAILEAATPPPPLADSQPPASISPPIDTPAWLKNTAPTAPQKPDPKPFLPTIRLAPGAQSPAPPSRRFLSTPEGASIAAVPIHLSQKRTEPTPTPPGEADPLLDLSIPLPAPTSAEPTHPPLTGSKVPPLFAAALTIPKTEPALENKTFVERKKSRRSSTPQPYKRRLLTTGRVFLLFIAAAGAIAYTYKPELRSIWDEKIRGRRPQNKPLTLPSLPNATGGSAPDVTIAPDPPVKKPQPPEPALPSAPTPAPVNPAPPVAEPDTEPLPAAPPPPVSTNSSQPLPTTEAGAKELISRLLHATSASQVRPYILNAARLDPTLDPYFASGHAVPVATHNCLLDRVDKIPATNRFSWSYKVTTDTLPSGFFYIVEQTPDGLRGDWELLSQSRDSALQKWIATPAAPAAAFYTGLLPQHTFPDMLPGHDITQYLAYTVGSAIISEPATTVFIPKAAANLAARAETLFKFSRLPYAPVLELTHKDGHIEITAILRENWRAPSNRK